MSLCFGNCSRYLNYDILFQNFTDPNVLQQLQQLQRLLTKNTEVIRTEPVHFDKKLLDFDYGDDDEEVNPSPRPQQQSANDSVSR